MRFKLPTLIRRAVPMVIVTLTAIAVACTQDKLAPTGLQKLSARRSNQLQSTTFKGSSRRRSVEDQSVRLANEIAGFGGLYLTPSRELVAFVKDTTSLGTLRTAATTALRAHLSSDGFGLPIRSRPSSVRVIPGNYDWQTLSGYRDFISDSLLGEHGVAMVDIDVVNNRVAVRVKSTYAGGAAELTQILTNHNIPLAAIGISLGSAPGNSSSPRAVATTARRFTPTFSALNDNDPDSLMGGVKFVTPAGSCSIGAVVDSAGHTRLLSASHCSQTMWALDYSLAKTFNGNVIGRETADPAPGTACNAFICWFHRGSDDSLWSMDSTYGVAHAKIGVIGRTSSRDSSALTVPFNVSLDSSHPFLYIYDTLTSSSLVVGAEIDKVGQRTGWQKGPVTHICLDYWLDSNSKKVYCAGEAHITLMHGDSGGPMFIWDGADGALMVGTANAEDPVYSPSNDSVFTGVLFSPWSSILTELGPIDPRNNTTVGTPSLTAVDSSGFAKLSWSAVSTTNTSSTTQYQIFQWTWDASTSSYTENGVLATTITSCRTRTVERRGP